MCFFFEGDGDHRDLHVLTHSSPTRRSSDLAGRATPGGWTGLALVKPTNPVHRVAAMHNPTSSDATPRARLPGDREMVFMMAMVMALNALAIDTMLPALPAIGDALGVASATGRQYVISDRQSTRLNSSH